MAQIKIDYDQIDSAMSYCSSITSQLLDYDSALASFNTRYDSLPGGSSSNTQECSYYVDAKITEIEAKAQRFDDSGSISDLAGRLQNLKNVAQSMDTSVGNAIAGAKDEFCEAKHIETNLWTDFTNWLISWTGDIPILDALGDLITEFFDDLSSAWDSLVYLYKCGGGKEVVGIVLAIAGAIASIAILVVSCIPPICGIVAVCALIGAAIAAISAIVNVINSFRAMNSKQNGDLAWSKIYGKQDTVQDWLRQTNFKNGTLNSLSYGAAVVIDVTELVCAVVSFADSIKQLGDVFKTLKIKAKDGGFAKVLKSYIFNTDLSKTGLECKPGQKVLSINGKKKYGDFIRMQAKQKGWFQDPKWWNVEKNLNKFWKGVDTTAKATKNFVKVFDGINNGKFSWKDTTKAILDVTKFKGLKAPKVIWSSDSLLKSVKKVF